MKAKKAEQATAHGSTMPSQEKVSANFKDAFLLKGNAIHLLPADHPNPDASAERKFKSAKELRELITTNSKALFGQQIFFIAAPKEGSDLFEGNTQPGGFLIDLADIARPKFYLLDIMMAKDSLFSHVFPRVSRFFALLHDTATREKLSQYLAKDKVLIKELEQKLKKVSDVPEYLKRAIIGKPFILLVMDGDFRQMSSLKNTYASTWQLVKPVLIGKYTGKEGTILTVSPPFAEIHSVPRRLQPGVVVTEEEHFKGVSITVSEIYGKIKTELLKINKQLQFNSQRYYISLRKDKNLAFFHVSRKRIALVVMYPEKDTRKLIKHHEVKTLTEKVQKFWNGPSCTIVLENAEHLNEIIALLKKLIKD